MVFGLSPHARAAQIMLRFQQFVEPGSFLDKNVTHLYPSQYLWLIGKSVVFHAEWVAKGM